MAPPSVMLVFGLVLRVMENPVKPGVTAVRVILDVLRLEVATLLAPTPLAHRKVVLPAPEFFMASSRLVAPVLLVAEYTVQPEAGALVTLDVEKV
jgi:hypothetical protein